MSKIVTLANLYICTSVMMDLRISSGFNVQTRVDLGDQLTSLVSKDHRWPFESSAI